MVLGTLNVHTQKNEIRLYLSSCTKTAANDQRKPEIEDAEPTLRQTAPTGKDFLKGLHPEIRATIDKVGLKRKSKNVCTTKETIDQ